MFACMWRMAYLVALCTAISRSSEANRSKYSIKQPGIDGAVALHLKSLMRTIRYVLGAKSKYIVFKLL
jgi:hypothetical protein